jgi:DNA-binding XRE family transcriptional regulator
MVDHGLCCVLYYWQIVVYEQMGIQCMVNSDFRYGVQVPYLKAWRMYRVLTQIELADRAHVHANTIRAAEGGRGVQITKIGKLSKALGVDRHTLVTTPPPGDPEDSYHEKA